MPPREPSPTPARRPGPVRALAMVFFASGIVLVFSAIAWLWTGNHWVTTVAGLLAAIVTTKYVRFHCEGAARQAWREAHAGEVYFVATGKRAWREFIENNVAPVLPPGMRLVWAHRRHHRQRLFWQHVPTHTARPFIATVFADHIDVFPLNEALRGLKKSCAGVDKEAQKQVAAHLSPWQS